MVQLESNTWKLIQSIRCIQFLTCDILFCFFKKDSNTKGFKFHFFYTVCVHGVKWWEGKCNTMHCTQFNIPTGWCRNEIVVSFAWKSYDKAAYSNRLCKLALQCCTQDVCKKQWHVLKSKILSCCKMCLGRVLRGGFYKDAAPPAPVFIFAVRLKCTCVY